MSCAHQLGGPLATGFFNNGQACAAARFARAAAGAAALLIACDDAAAQGRFGRGGDVDAVRTERRIGCSAPSEAEAAVPAGNEQADVPVCRVDVSTYVGWRVFNAYCATCHAAHATGSTYAPDLTFRMRGMERRAFFTVLDDGYRGRDADSPPHAANPDLSRYREELWAYLSARVSGALPARPLEPLPAAAE